VTELGHSRLDLTRASADDVGEVVGRCTGVRIRIRSPPMLLCSLPSAVHSTVRNKQAAARPLCFTRAPAKGLLFSFEFRRNTKASHVDS
jgi:hypothetical protein